MTLIFIDKYTQVRRILAPIVAILDQLDELEEDEHLLDYVVSTF